MKYFHMPSAIDSIKQVDCCKLLGVGLFLQSSLKLNLHVQYISIQCARRMYIVKLLRSQGMPIVQLSTITYSLIIARLLFAFPSWGGFISTEYKHKINAFLSELNPVAT